MRLVVLLALLALAPCGAQDLPDPGRRLSKEEQQADPERRTTKPAESRSRDRPRDPPACERSRTYYQLACRAPGSPHSRSMDCAEAYALYRQSCFSD